MEGRGRRRSRAGAPDDQVLPSARRLVYDLHQEREKDPATRCRATPRSRRRSSRCGRWPTSRRRSTTGSSTTPYGRPDVARVARLRTEAARHIAVAVRGTIPEGDRTRVARKALEAGQFAGGPRVGPRRRPHGVRPLRGRRAARQVAGAEGHEVPEALTALAEAALR